MLHHALTLAAAAFAAVVPAVVVAAEPVALAAKPLETPPGIVSGATARALVGAGAVVVDVRTRAEFEAGHVPNAKHIPYDELASRAAEVGGASTPVVLYCRTGRRSAIAANTLKQLGYQKVWDMQVLERWDEKQR